MKFQYSPGLVGYGAKGVEGSTGLSGLALYFTDRNPISDIISVRNAIKNNEVLWTFAAPGTKLPGGRVYLNYDLFIDTRGYVYRITNPATGEYINTGMSLNKSTFFEFEIQSGNGFDRFNNKFGPPGYIIDNVFTDIGGINYSNYPSKIYGISPKNYARIEYSNIHDVSDNAFSLYSSGENTVVDDHKAFGLVRKINSNSFRIGNLDDGNFLRDMDLYFDVMSLKHNKDNNRNSFSINTPAGTVITNREISTNLSFDPNFNSSPVSFTGSSTSTSVKMDWVLSDFVSDSDDAVLYFYYKDPSVAYSVDSPNVRPLVFHLNPISNNIGSIIITNLTLGRLYEYYIIFRKNGWERKSTIKQITTTNTPIYLNILSPTPAILTADYSGKFDQNLSNTYNVTLNTNSFTGWRSTDVPQPAWVNLSKTSSPIAGPDAFNVTLSVNSGTASRSGNITLSSEAPNKTISVTQNCYQTWVSFNDTGNLVFTPPLLPDQHPVVTVKLYSWVRVQRDYALGTRTVRGKIDFRQSSTILGSADIARTAHNNSKDASSNPAGPEYIISRTIYPVPATQYDFTVSDDVLECDYDNNGDYEFSQVWAEISNAYMSTGTGRIDISTNKIWYAKNPISSSPRCTRTYAAASSVPAMGAFV